LHLRSSHEPYSICGRTDNSIDTGLGKLLGYYSNTNTRCFTQTRCSNDPAIRRPRRQRRPNKNHHGHKKKANPGLLASQRMNSQPGETTAADQTAGALDTSHTSLIHDGLTPPPPWNSTPHTVTPTLQQVLDPTKIGRVQHERRAQLARYHPLGEENEQAGGNSLQLRRESTPHATKSTLQQSYGPANMRQNPKLLAWLARYHPLGEGHEPACLEHKEKPDNTQVTVTAQYTHSALLKSSNRPMAAARRRQGQQLYAWHGTPSRRPQTAPPFPLTPAGEVIHPQPPTLPPEVWPSECNTNKAKQPKRDKFFLSTTHC